MDLKLVDKTDKGMTVKFLDSDEAFVYILLEELWKDKKVSTAEYKKSHPTLDSPTIILTVSDGKPETALKRAAKSVSGQFKEMRTVFEKVAG